MSLDMDAVHRYAELTRMKKAGEDQIDVLREELAKLDVYLVQMFAEEGVKSLRVEDPNGGPALNVGLRRELWASVPPEHFGRVVDILRDLGEGDIVKEAINTHSLSALVRAWERTDSIPPELQDLLKISPTHKMRATKAS